MYVNNMNKLLIVLTLLAIGCGKKKPQIVECHPLKDFVVSRILDIPKGNQVYRYLEQRQVEICLMSDGSFAGRLSKLPTQE